MLQVVKTILCDDPPSTHRLNANSFQSSALTTFNSWQYAAFYVADSKNAHVRRVTLARRQVASGLSNPSSWQSLTFVDYEQTTDDGHNVICIGVCKGDGTIHVSFDHHCDILRYRVSCPGLATTPEKHEWTPGLFSPMRSTLPGLEHRQNLFNEVTYPVFVPTEDGIFFECRTGKAGAGSEMLFFYSSSSQKYSFIGTYLVGINNNPYINGLSYRNARLHVSWTYRGFIEYSGAGDIGSIAHKAQAGPNGPENNYDLMYAWSEDMGTTWKGSLNETLARCQGENETKNIDYNEKTGIFPDTPGIVVQRIPKYSGIMNQEAQCVGSNGDFHVLNRDNTSGEERWRHFTRNASTGEWNSAVITQVHPTETGPRGKLVHDETGGVYIVLPGNQRGDSSLTILRRAAIGEQNGVSKYADGFEVLWRGEGYDGEPLIDEQRLTGKPKVLSIFTRTIRPESKVVVLEFDLD